MGRTVVIGAGPAGLTAAFELAKLGREGIVLEQDHTVGGLARTVDYKGYRFDIGGHRFFTKVPLVQSIWQEILGDALIERPRLSRILYDGKFFEYPLKPTNALLGLGPIESIRIASSYAASQFFPIIPEDSLEHWVVNRFGRRLFQIFFKSYTEKVWGVSCREISADWAAQRIKNLDLREAVKNALLGGAGKGGELITTLIERFHYPRLGPGMMWERCRDLAAVGGVRTETDARVVRARHREGRLLDVTVRDHSGRESVVEGEHFISSMPIPDLMNALEPEAPAAVRAAAGRLRFRDFLTIVLVVNRPDVFPDNWVYVHSPEVLLGRIQNFKNWSPEMVPDPGTTSLGLEYFVDEGDEVWSAPDEDLLELGQRECASLGLVDASEVIDGTVIRMPKAYPVYDRAYRSSLAVAREYLSGFRNLQLVGRNGQHRYNNQDHSMLTAVYAVRNLEGAQHDVFDVNAEGEYIEGEAASGKASSGPAASGTDAMLRTLFARFDPVALGGALALLAGGALFVATAVLLLRGGRSVGPTLGLLSNYLVGFSMSWLGAVVGGLEAGAVGFGLGYLMASAINVLVRIEESALRRRLELERAMDPFAGGEG